MSDRGSRHFRVGLVVFALMLAAPLGTALSAYRIRAVNTQDAALESHVVAISADHLPASLRGEKNLTVLDSSGRPVPTQVDDLDGDGAPDEVAFLVDLPPLGGRSYEIREGGHRAVDTPLGVGAGPVMENGSLRCRVMTNGEIGVSIEDIERGELLARKLIYAPKRQRGSLGQGGRRSRRNAHRGGDHNTGRGAGQGHR